MPDSINLSDPVKTTTRHLSAPSSKDNSYSSDDWRLNLKRTDKFALINNEVNVALILTLAPEFKGKIFQDVFSKTTMITAPMPWKRINTPMWQEDDNLQLLAWLQLKGMTRIKLETVQKGARMAALQNQINPILDYLKSLKWDKIPRLNDWLTTCMNVEATAYTKAIAPKVLISAVARAFQPGVKVDTMLILEGNQGTGKSTAIRVLFGEDHFTDQLPSIHKHQEAGIQLQGKWVVEVAELRGLKRAGSDVANAFLTQKDDEFRAPYAIDKIKHPRSCIFIGTTNEDTYLKDPTGARRFWPVRCGEADLAKLAKDRDQLWAEAVHRYKNDEPWHLTPQEEQLAKAEQEESFEEDAWALQIDAIMVAITSDSLDKLQSQTPDWITLNPPLRQGRLLPIQIAQIMGFGTDKQNQDLFRRIATHLRHRTWFMKNSGHKWYHPSPEWLQKQKAKSKQQDSTDEIEVFAALFADLQPKYGSSQNEEPSQAAKEEQSSLNPDDYDPEDFPDHFTIEDVESLEETGIPEPIMLTLQQEADLFVSANLLQKFMNNPFANPDHKVDLTVKTATLPFPPDSP